jgi:stearoyl-CoA desaturase (delta-9 desaturase)
MPHFSSMTPVTSCEDDADDEHDDIIYPSVIPFLLVHFACFAAMWSGISWQAVAIGVTLYWLRMFAICAGYHRYFSHRSYSTGRVFQFILAFLAQSSAQRSVLWWAAKHRHHHLHSDTARDAHSPRHKGFIYSHVGWLFSRRHATANLVKIADFANYPELMWLHRFELLPALVVAGLCFVLASWSGLIVGFFWSTVVVYHATFCINSLAHVRGRKRYVTGDDSCNNWFLAVLSLGEGWHNNHHAYQSSVRQGFRGWEIDPTYYILRVLSWFGAVWGLKTPPVDVLRNEQQLGTRVINRAAEQLASHFSAERIALGITADLQAHELWALGQALACAQHRTAEVLASTMHLQQLPTREEFLANAKAIFTGTKSLDAIVDRAYELVMAAVGARLATDPLIR